MPCAKSCARPAGALARCPCADMPATITLATKSIRIDVRCPHAPAEGNRLAGRPTMDCRRADRLSAAAWPHRRVPGARCHHIRPLHRPSRSQHSKQPSRASMMNACRAGALGPLRNRVSCVALARTAIRRGAMAHLEDNVTLDNPTRAMSPAHRSSPGMPYAGQKNRRINAALPGTRCAKPSPKQPRTPSKFRKSSQFPKRHKRMRTTPKHTNETKDCAPCGAPAPQHLRPPRPRRAPSATRNYRKGDHKFLCHLIKQTRGTRFLYVAWHTGPRAAS